VPLLFLVSESVSNPCLCSFYVSFSSSYLFQQRTVQMYTIEYTYCHEKLKVEQACHIRSESL
jgi:hypothetical protein